MSASSSFAPGTPAKEAVSSAVDEDEGGAPEPACTSSKNKVKSERRVRRTVHALHLGRL